MKNLSLLDINYRLEIKDDPINNESEDLIYEIKARLLKYEVLTIND